jgi:mono/diheme cytochrome c family protein
MALGVALAASWAWAEPPAGAETFSTKCSFCHQADGAGAAGLAPPLRGTLKTDLASDDGRRYLSQILISGMAGPIKSQGQSWSGMMPSFAASLSDADIAATLNYVLVSFNGVDGKDPALLTPLQIAEARKLAPKPGETRKLREVVKQGVD